MHCALVLSFLRPFLTALSFQFSYAFWPIFELWRQNLVAFSPLQNSRDRLQDASGNFFWSAPESSDPCASNDRPNSAKRRMLKVLTFGKTNFVKSTGHTVASFFSKNKRMPNHFQSFEKWHHVTLSDRQLWHEINVCPVLFTKFVFSKANTFNIRRLADFGLSFDAPGSELSSALQKKLPDACKYFCDCHLDVKRGQMHLSIGEVFDLRRSAFCALFLRLLLPYLNFAGNSLKGSGMAFVRSGFETFYAVICLKPSVRCLGV